jgi:formate dehydrogenase maturation protein FdhE
MSERPRRHDEIRGASVLLTGWSEGREDEVAEALGKISRERIDLDRVDFPIVALAKASLDKAEAAQELLVAAGGSVALEDAWVTREEPRTVASRPTCPFCGSTKTQRYTHAGPASRSMKCTTCGRTFRVRATPSVG